MLRLSFEIKKNGGFVIKLLQIQSRFKEIKQQQFFNFYGDVPNCFIASGHHAKTMSSTMRSL